LQSRSSRRREGRFRNALRLRETALPAAHIQIALARVGVGAALRAQQAAVYAAVLAGPPSS
jgi:hypothetical protein